MNTRLIFKRIIPIILCCAWLGSCAAGIFEYDYRKSADILKLCMGLFVLILFYVPVQLIFYRKPKKISGDRTINKKNNKSVVPQLLSFFALMIFIAFWASYVLPGHLVHKKNLAFRAETKAAIDNAIMAQQVFFKEHGEYADNIQDLDKYISPKKIRSENMEFKLKKLEKNHFVISARYKKHYEWYRYTWLDGEGKYELLQLDWSSEPF